MEQKKTGIFRSNAPINFLFHPVILSLVITLIVIFLLPRFPTYTATVTDRKQAPRTGMMLYDDLDGNGYSDEIITSMYDNGQAAVTVTFQPSLFFQEWDIPGIFSFASDRYVMTGDCDQNGEKELYLFTIAGDSILLTVIDDLFSKAPLFTTRYIDTLGNGSEEPHLSIVPGSMEDLDQDGSGELIFAVNAGYSLTPRTVYAVDVRHNRIITSPRGGYHILNLLQADITGDGLNEIVVNGYASMNTRDPSLEIDDSCCWLIVLDRDLQFLFSPVRFEAQGYSDLTTVAVPNESGSNDLYSLYAPPMLSGRAPALLKTDATGKVVREQEIAEAVKAKTTGLHPFQNNGKWHLAVGTDSPQTLVYSTGFVWEKTLPYRASFVYSSLLDIDGDQNNEVVIPYPQGRRITLMSADLSDATSVDLTLDVEYKTSLSVRKAGDGPILLFIDSGTNGYLIAYEKNPLYYARWGIYAAIFLAFYLFTLLIRKIQRSQLEHRFQSERKITELQMRLIRNQLDPHFTFNTITVIGNSVLEKQTDKAYRQILQLARLMRFGVDHSDKLSRNLSEELEFVRSYLELMKDCLPAGFTYQIEPGEETDLSLPVPKMILQIYAENAIKHGIRHLEKEGVIRIKAFTRDNVLILEISDNGIGRNAARAIGSEGTGRGLQMMEEYYRLYETVTGTRISSETNDLTDEQGKAAGTSVRLTIRLS